MSRKEMIDVEALAQLLAGLGVESAIQPMRCVCRLSAAGPEVEHGAVLELYNCSRADFRDRVWPALKQTLALRCGYVTESSRGFSGCTENFVQPSACPHCLAPQEGGPHGQAEVGTGRAPALVLQVSFWLFLAAASLRAPGAQAVLLSGLLAAGAANAAVLGRAAAWRGAALARLRSLGQDF